MEQQKKFLQFDPSKDYTAHLSRREISLYRNSVKQNICVDLLMDGDHRSFSELFCLLASDQQRREADPAVELQTPPLEEQLDKLETIKLHLSRAERAERTGLWSSSCEQYFLLGRFFSSPEDVWLRQHFYRRCSDGGRGSRPAVEAQVWMSQFHLEEGEVEEARQQAELSLQQVEDGWLDSEGRVLKIRTLQVLWRIYSRLADARLAAGDHREALELLRGGYSIACKTEDKRIEGEAAFKLGLTYQSAGEHEAARQLFSSCMQISESLQDSVGLTKVYKATADSLQSEGNMDEAVRCLQKLADVSRRGGLHQNLAESLMSLGDIDYSKVKVGVARAHILFKQRIADIVTAVKIREPE